MHHYGHIDTTLYVEYLAMIMFVSGLSVRFIQNNQDAYIASRILLSISLLLFYLQTLRYFRLFKTIGPKLIMIEKMVSIFFLKFDTYNMHE
jgi:hypothetical protein